MAERWAKVPEAVLYHPDVSDGAVRLYAVLERHGARAEPTRRRLAELLRCSLDTIDRRAAELVAAGVLVVEPRFTEAGDRTSNGYVLTAKVRPAPAAPSRPQKRKDAATLSGKDAAPGTRESSKERVPTEPSSAVAEVDRFDEFWQQYPRKVGKPMALKAWNAHGVKAGVDVVLAGLAAWCAHWRAVGTEQEFIPHPSTWLNQHRWNDPTPQRRARPMGSPRAEANERNRAEAIAALIPGVQVGTRALEASRDT